MELKKVLGNNIQDFANNIDENFSRISENGIWRGEKGESYTEKTIVLWGQDETTGSIVIADEQILKTLFTETDGSASDWNIVKEWSVSDSDKFISLGIPKEWNMYPGYPLYYSQPVKCFKYFNTSGVGKDWSGMVAVVGENTYRRYDLLPRLYVDPVSGNYCWMINGVKTGVAASVNPDTETRNIRLYLIRNDADGLKYLVANNNNVIWTDIPDTQPRVGDFAWRLSIKTVTSGGENKDAQVLEVCIFNGIEWSAATVDESNSNFFITYDDAVMTYIWQHIYSDLGDTYTDSLDASNIHSFQFPVKNDKGEAEANKTHKITSKSFNNGHRSDLLIEAPGDTGSYTYSKLVISGYEDVVLAKPIINDKGELVYEGDSLARKCKIIKVEDMNKIDFGEIDNGQLFCIDRCYWKDTEGADQWCLSVTETVDGVTMYHTRNYVRYVFLKAYICDDNVVWDTHGIGVTLTGKEKSNIYTSDEEECYMGGVFEVGFKQVTNNDEYRYSDNPGKIYNKGTETAIDWTKFGVITGMRDPVNGNYTNFDFLQGNAFRRYRDEKYNYKLSPGLRMDSNYCRYRDAFSNNRIIMDCPGNIHGLYDGFIGVMEKPSDMVSILNYYNNPGYGPVVFNNVIENSNAFILANLENANISNNKIIYSGLITQPSSLNGSCYIYASAESIENCNIQNSIVKLEVVNIKDVSITNCKFNNIWLVQDQKRSDYTGQESDTELQNVAGYIAGGEVFGYTPGTTGSETQYKLLNTDGLAKTIFKNINIYNCKFDKIKSYYMDTSNHDDFDKYNDPVDLCILCTRGYNSSSTTSLQNFDICGGVMTKFYSYMHRPGASIIKDHNFYIDIKSLGKRNYIYYNENTDSTIPPEYSAVAVIGLHGNDPQIINNAGYLELIKKQIKSDGDIFSVNTSDFINILKDSQYITLMSELNIIDNLSYNENDKIISSLYSKSYDKFIPVDDNRKIIPLFDFDNKTEFIIARFGIHSIGQTKSLTTLLSQ